MQTTDKTFKKFEFGPSKEIEWKGLKQVKCKPSIEKERRTKKILHPIKGEEDTKGKGIKYLPPPGSNAEQVK